MGLNGYSVHDKITGLTLDGAWRPDTRPLRAAALRRRLHRPRRRAATTSATTGPTARASTARFTRPPAARCSATHTRSARRDSTSSSDVSLPNFMQGAGGSYPMVLPQLNVGAAARFPQEPERQAESRSTAPRSPACAPVRFRLQHLPQVNPYNSYAVTEKTISRSIWRRDFAAERWSGNCGVRVVHTTTTANTALRRAGVTVDSIEYGEQHAAPGTCSTEIRRRSAPMAATPWRCPRLNLAYWVVPNQLQVRLALAETMARPDLNRTRADVDQQCRSTARRSSTTTAPRA